MTTRREADEGAGDRDRDTHQDPGSYIGRMPERATESIPGGVSDEDERVAAHSTRPAPTGGDAVPEGHREGRPVTDDSVREAGQER